MDKNSAIQDSMQDLKALAEFVQSHLQRPGVSTHSIADNAKGGISHGTVWNIANNNGKEVKERTLVALARGLGVSFEVIQSIVKGKQLALTDPFDSLKVLFYGWDEATDEDRRDVMGAIRLIGEGFQQRLRHRARAGTGQHSPKVTKGGVELNNRGRKTG